MLPQPRDAPREQPDPQPHIVRVHVQEMPRTGQPVETGRTSVAARGWGGAGMGFRVSFWGDGMFWNHPVVWTHNTVNTLNTTVLHALKC